MCHPFLYLSKSNFPRFFWPFFVVTIVLLVVMSLISEPLVTQTAPQGIISFELARTGENSVAILESWDSTQKLIAAFGLGLDYLFIIFYSTTLSLGCIWCSTLLNWRNPALLLAGTIIAWLQWAAGIFDAIENIALFRLLSSDFQIVLPFVAYWCAVLKFGIIVAGFLWCVFAVALRYTNRRKSTNNL